MGCSAVLIGLRLHGLVSIFIENFFRAFILQDVQFKSIVSMIYLLDMIERELVFLFLWNNLSHDLMVRKKKLWLLRLHQLRATKAKQPKDD